MNLEKLAERYWQRYGYYPPGKDNPVGVTFDEKQRQRNWLEFLEEQDKPGDRFKISVDAESREVAIANCEEIIRHLKSHAFQVEAHGYCSSNFKLDRERSETGDK